MAKKNQKSSKQEEVAQDEKHPDLLHRIGDAISEVFHPHVQKDDEKKEEVKQAKAELPGKYKKFQKEMK